MFLDFDTRKGHTDSTLSRWLDCFQCKKNTIYKLQQVCNGKSVWVIVNYYLKYYLQSDRAPI